MTATRDRILSPLLGIDLSSGLNTTQGQSLSQQEGLSLVEEIGRVFGQIKAASISEDGSEVDYKKIKASPVYADLHQLTGHLSAFDPRQLRGREEQLAFWINIYNLLVLDAVIQHDIRESVTESRLGILAFFQRAAYWINNQRYSLEAIEHGILRENRGFPYFPGQQFSAGDSRIQSVIQPMDPRIHFALNCASNSCPPIGIYTSSRIYEQLEMATRSFVSADLVSDKRNQTITISRIFSWYRKDFGGRSGLLKFLIDHLSENGTRDWLSNNEKSIRIGYHAYDWRLINSNP